MENSIKALVIEDSRIYQQMIQAVFADLGVEARFEETGGACLEALEEEDFHIICLDLHLPDIDGIEVCRRLREQEKYRFIPVVLLTEEDDDALLKHAFFRRVAARKVQRSEPGLDIIRRRLEVLPALLGFCSGLLEEALSLLGLNRDNKTGGQQ